MKPLQDDILIRRAAAKDESAFEQLMLLHQKPVYNICYRMAGNADDALDLSQEVFLKLWRTLEQYQFDAAFSTWLFRLTQNVCIDFLRRKYRQMPIVGMEPAVKPACLNTRSGVVGVLATARSLDGDLFRRTAARYGENIRVLTAVGEGFVELVEEDREQSPEAVETVRRVLEPMIREGADQIVLGCTHYPFLLPVFRQVIGERGVAVVDPSPAVGRRVGQLLDQYDLRAEKGATANYGFLTFADEAYRSRLECKAFG